MVIVDGSGSMWGNLGTDKRPKLEVVREALRALLPSLRPDARVGLASFGHRRRGNCGDAEVIVPPEVMQPERLAVPVDKMNAMGKGPIGPRAARISQCHRRSHARQHRARRRRPRQLRTGRLCRHGRDPRRQPEPRRSHRGGRFRQGEAGADRCIAQQTGGKLWDAQDAAGLARRSDKPSRSPICRSNPCAGRREADADNPGRKPAPGAPPGLYLSAGLGRAVRRSTTPSIGGSPRPEPTAHWCATSAPPRCLRNCEPGTYEVEASLGLAQARQTVEVAADTATQVRVDLNGGVLKMQARAADTRRR